MSLSFKKLTQSTINSDLISAFNLREAYRWFRVFKKEELVWRDLDCQLFTHGNQELSCRNACF